MAFFIHVYFGIAKLIFSFISRRDKKFVIGEICNVILLLILVVMFTPPLTDFFKYHMQGNLIVGNFFYPLLCGLLYLGLSLVVRLIFPADPGELAQPVLKQIPKKGKRIADIKKTPIAIGIIDFAWILILAGVYMAVLYCSKLDIIIETVPKGKGLEYYKIVYDEVNFMFTKSLDMILLLGSILAVCMSILWGDQLWTKTDEESRIAYKSTTIASIKMVTAYFLIAIAVIIWFTLPAYEKVTSIKGFIN
jgi:hypothetical protein